MFMAQARADDVTLERLEARHCDRCGETHRFKVQLRYGYFALYWVFGMVTHRSYALVCEGCLAIQEIDASEAGSLLMSVEERDPIPFMQRFGLLCLFAGTIGLVLIFGFLMRRN
jgi:hypothetical protein